MLQFGLRLGERPRQVVTTTPRPIALLKRLIADPATALTRAGTQANARHLSPAFLEHGVGALRRHAARPPGDRRRDHRGPRRRAVVARADREPAASARRRRSQRIVVAVDPPASTRQARRCLRPGRGRPRRGRHDLRARRRDRGGAFARRLGGEGDRAVAPARGRCAGGGGQPGRRHGARGDRARPTAPCR